MLKAAIKRQSAKWLEGRGIDVEHRLQPYQRKSRDDFFAAEQAARQRYEALDAQYKQELPGILEARYKDKPVLGKRRVYDAIAELATVIDPLDPYLGAISQLTHQLQLATDMENDGVDDTLLICGLVHDLGKLLIKVTDEDPMNVEAAGEKVPLTGTLGGGLLNCTFRWDHGDFGYLRLKDYASPEIAWLVRHHSIDVAACEPYMNEQDREYTARYLHRLIHYDHRKDMYAIPKKSLEDYRSLIDSVFPHEILI
jgi:hypothetical protein